MKRPVLALLALVGSAALAIAQAPGFGINGPTGPLYSGGEPAEITRRILASTITSYRSTPGDTYQLIMILEGTTVSYPLMLQENYELDVPYVGTVNAKGMLFSDLRKLVMDQLRRSVKLATYITFTLQTPARFDVPIFGGVEMPGVVTVTPLSMVSDAIALAKGIRPGGSYRLVKLQRGGTELTVDLLAYNNGDPGGPNNPYLQPGDRIVVPMAQVQVSLSGLVRFPGAYELVPGETLAQLLAYAGGLLPEAQPESVEVVSFAADGTQTMRVIDSRTHGATRLANGDRVRVRSISENQDAVLVIGGLYGKPVTLDRPMPVPLEPISVTVPWTPGLSVLRLLDGLGGPTPYARGKEAVLIRKRTGERLPVNVEALWSTRDPSADLALEPGDTLSVPVVNEVFVTGQVRTPGQVPYQPSLTVADYLLAAGGIDLLTGSPDAVYLMDAAGRRTRVGSTDTLTPGTVIYVGENTWTSTQRTFGNVTIVTSFVTAIMTFAALLVNFYISYVAPKP